MVTIGPVIDPPRDLHEDCRFWNLSRMQCIHHHARLAGMYAKRTQAQAAATMMVSKRSVRLVLVLSTLSFGFVLLDILC